MSIAEYFEWYILYIPKAVYGWGLAVFLLVLTVAILWRGRKEGFRLAALFLLIEYVALLLYFTVFIWRNTGTREYALMPFWSYWAALKGARVLAQEIVMNIVVFIPVGFLTGWMQKRATWKTTVLTGATISITIELLQLTLKRGCCETDDVINNSIGCLMGYWLFLLTKKMV